MIKVNIEKIAKEQVEPFFEQWEALSKLIHDAHTERNGKAKSFMVQGIDLFEQCIVFCSERPQITEDEEYEIVPLNGKERLQFIKSRPGQYACYRQLDELFKELKKRIARFRVKKQ